MSGIRHERHLHRLLADNVVAAYHDDLGAIGAFLPQQVPHDTLPEPFERYVQAGKELPLHYPADRGGVREWLDRQFGRPDPFAISALAGLGQPELESLSTALSVLGHVYRWDTIPPVRNRFTERRINFPPGLEQLWGEVSALVGLPRVGTTWSMHLCNWRMTDRPGGAAYRPQQLHPGNLRVAYQWLAPPADRDLENFSLSFVLMEAAGAGALRALVHAIDASARHDMDAALSAFAELKVSVKAMSTSFTTMVRNAHIDPAVWLELIQPTFAWAVATDNESLEGPSGMQLGTLQCLDAALGVAQDSLLATECRHARRYLPPSHRHFVDTVDSARFVIPDFVRTQDSESLRAHVNACLKWIRTFRIAHAARGARYLRTGRDGTHSRVSTGLGTRWRPEQDGGASDNAPQITHADPVQTFEQQMAERISETSTAFWGPAVGSV